MFVRIIKDSFARQPRRKLLTMVALALGTAIATATLSVALDIGDRLAREFRSLGANLLVTPEADTLPLEIGGVDYRPVDSGVFLSDAELGKLKTIFWRNNVIGFAPFLDVPIALNNTSSSSSGVPLQAILIGTWYRHDVTVPNGGGIFTTGVSSTDPGWQVEGHWFADHSAEAVMGVSLARRAGVHAGQTLEIRSGQARAHLAITGIISTGGQEDDAILAPLDVAQQISGKPGTIGTCW